MKQLEAPTPRGMRLMWANGILVATMLLAGCASVTVTTDHDPAANFSGLHTYAWRATVPETGDPRFDGKLIDKRVRAAVDRVLAAKGFQATATGDKADFLVGYDVVIQTKTNFDTINHRHGYRTGGWHGGPQVYEYDYDEGTLLIDVINPPTVQLLWRGIGKGVVDPTASPEKREQRINDAVDRILADFPPR